MINCWLFLIITIDASQTSVEHQLTVNRRLKWWESKYYLSLYFQLKILRSCEMGQNLSKFRKNIYFLFWNTHSTSKVIHYSRNAICLKTDRASRLSGLNSISTTVISSLKLGFRITGRELDTSWIPYWSVQFDHCSLILLHIQIYISYLNILIWKNPEKIRILQKCYCYLIPKIDGSIFRHG